MSFIINSLNGISIRFAITKWVTSHHFAIDSVAFLNLLRLKIDNIHSIQSFYGNIHMSPKKQNAIIRSLT